MNNPFDTPDLGKLDPPEPKRKDKFEEINEKLDVLTDSLKEIVKSLASLIKNFDEFKKNTDIKNRAGRFQVVHTPKPPLKRKYGPFKGIVKEDYV